jgi:5-oxoprolinase (ATP-hydrolysing) subunit B
VNVLPYGERAVLLEPTDPAAVLTVRDWLVEQGYPGVVAVVPAARTVLVEVDPALLSVIRLRELLTGAEPVPPTDPAPGNLLELPVRYDGADLAAVADQLAIGAEELIRLHSGTEYTVSFCGFSPGFGYLSGLDPRLRVSRLATPRPSVPAGSVAIADEFTGVYPRVTPGGWRLLGRTDVPLFDLSRQPPAVLTPGTRVRFVPR